MILRLLLFATIAARAWGAIAFDNSTSAISAAAASSLTYSHTVNSATNGFLFVAVQETEATVTVSTVTYAGAALTFLRRDNGTGNANIKIEVWYKIAPAAGANNVVVTMTGAVGATSRIISGAISMTGVDQASPIDAQAGGGSTGTGLTASQAVTTVADNAWVLEATGSGNGSIVWTSAETQRWSQNFSGGNNASNGATFGPQTPAGSKTMTETLSTSANWAISVASLKPAAAAATVRRNVMVVWP